MKGPKEKWCVARHKRDKAAQRSLERAIERKTRQAGKKECAAGIPVGVYLPNTRPDLPPDEDAGFQGYVPENDDGDW
jgi:hypothetical protein